MRAIETYAIEGTAAIDIHRGRTGLSASDLGIVAVRTGKKAVRGRGAHAAEPEDLKARASRAFRNVLESSEMYCSLKYEDFRGCAYGVFTRRGVAALSAVSCCVATLSIVAGA